ncbi:hypothetical protein FRB95_009366 [Tulasnella sp. JGI-2019a]|nr:hypothetical protein FRB95_009366 [Tulasnella sp. JGI-2019a]
MSGPILQGERNISWAPRSDSSGSNGSPNVPRQRATYPAIMEEPPPGENHIPQSSLPGSIADIRPSSQGHHHSSRILDAPIAASPAAIPPEEQADAPSPTAHTSDQRQTAPAELGPHHKRVTYSVKPVAGDTIGPTGKQQAAKPRLDPSAPFRAMKNPPSIPEEERQLVTEEDVIFRAENEGSSLPREDATSAAQPNADERLPGTWGTAFKVQWIKTSRLPFNRVRHLRNRWNYDREVKVSRDGTELEPTTGDGLLREWDRLEEERRRQAPERTTVEQTTRTDGMRPPGHVTIDDPTQHQARAGGHTRGPQGIHAERSFP